MSPFKTMSGLRLQRKRQKEVENPNKVVSATQNPTESPRRNYDAESRGQKMPVVTILSQN
jgi:hypothetical protein